MWQQKNGLFRVRDIWRMVGWVEESAGSTFMPGAPDSQRTCIGGSRSGGGWVDASNTAGKPSLPPCFNSWVWIPAVLRKLQGDKVRGMKVVPEWVCDPLRQGAPVFHTHIYVRGMRLATQTGVEHYHWHCG